MILSNKCRFILETVFSYSLLVRLSSVATESKNVLIATIIGCEEKKTICDISLRSIEKNNYDSLLHLVFQRLIKDILGRGLVWFGSG